MTSPAATRTPDSPSPEIPAPASVPASAAPSSSLPEHRFGSDLPDLWPPSRGLPSAIWLVCNQIRNSSTLPSPARSAQGTSPRAARHSASALRNQHSDIAYYIRSGILQALTFLAHGAPRAPFRLIRRPFPFPHDSLSRLAAIPRQL